MSTTIFFKLKLKRTRTPMEVFEKMKKSVKKKGATKNWICDIDEAAPSMTIDFGDNESETFYLSFDDKKVCNGFCKVYFPLSGDEFDDEKKSEFKALLNMIYSARTSFSEMEITDDYGISESFLESKVNKINLRELTEEETKRAEKLLAEGHTNIREFITALMYDYRDMPYSEDFIPYINKEIGQRPTMFWNDFKIADFYEAFTDSFLFETTEYQNRGRLYKIGEYYSDLNGVFFAVHAFVFGISTITGYFIYEKGWDPKSTQVLRLYYNKCLPLIEAEESDNDKCILAYRFFVSIMDYLGFKYAGRDNKQIKLIDGDILNGVRILLEKGDLKPLDDALSEEMRKQTAALFNTNP